MNLEAMFGSLAGASAAMYGVPAGFYASRLISLSERAATVQREHGDIVNQQGIHGPDRETEWAARLRRDALADLYEVASSVRRTSTLLGVGALVLILGSLVPFVVGTLEETWYAIVLLSAFGFLGVWWMGAFRASASGLLSITRVQNELRRKQREEATRAGHGYLVSGDPAALRDPAIVDRVVKDFPHLSSTWRRRLSMRLWKYRIRRRKEPLV